MNFALLGTLDYPLPVSDIWAYAAIGADTTEYALMGIFNGTAVISLQNPSQPVQTAFIPGPQSLWRDIKTHGSRAYVSNETGNGIAVINLSALPSGNVSHHYVSPVVPGLGQITTAHNLWVDELGYLYVSGSNINSGGVIIFDVFTQPDTPAFVGMGPQVYSHDVFARGNLMYSADIYQGYFSVYDITQRSNPILLNFQSTDFQFTHNVWLSDDGNTLFTTDEQANAPVGIFDVSDPFNIVRLGAFRPSGSLGQGVIPHNAHVHHDFVVISYYTDGVVVFDGKRPHNPIEVGVYDTYPGTSGGFNGAWGAYPFLPSGLVLVSDMQSGLFVLQPQYQRACWIEGTITDANTGLPIHNAVVHIDSINVQSASDLYGAYATGFAFAGNYMLSVVKPGYDTLSIGVQLVNDSLIELDIVLIPTQCSVNINCQVPALYYTTDSNKCHAHLSFEALPDGNCGPYSMLYTVNNNAISFPHLFPLGLTTVNAQVTDSDNNTAGCAISVFVIDTEPPLLICPPDTTFILTEGSFATYVELPAALYADNCSSVWVNNSYNAQGEDASGYYVQGVHTVHFLATDGSGNTTSCATAVQVLPSLSMLCTDTSSGFLMTDTCIAYIEIPQPVVSGGLPPYLIENNIFPAQQEASGYYPPGETWIEFTVTDSTGNTAMCNTLLLVTDSLNRTLICLPDTVLINEPGQCGATLHFGFNAEAGCFAEITYWPESGSFFPIGTSPVQIIATGWGGIQDTCVFLVTVHDGEEPVIVCPPDTIVYIGYNEPGVIISLPPATASDNCSITSISNSFSGASSQASGFFSSGLTQIFYQATDSAQNNSFCHTQVWVIPDSTVPVYYISGHIGTFAGTPLPNTSIFISGSQDTLLWTDSAGLFLLQNVYHGAVLSAEAGRDEEPLLGITTYDIILIQQHILNVEPLPDPYTKIAADVNGNGVIEIGDMVQLRRLLLMYDTAFVDPFTGLANNTSWRFPLPGLSDPTPTSPVVPAFDEQHFIASVQGDIGELDFIAVKIGDTDQSATTEMVDDYATYYRHPPVYWEIAHKMRYQQIISNTEQINIPEELHRPSRLQITATTNLEMDGFQLALGPLPQGALELRVESSLPGWSPQHYHHVRGNSDYLLISYNHSGVFLRAGEPVFEVHYESLASAELAEWPLANRAILAAEVYMSAGNRAAIRLSENPLSVSEDAAQATLHPNPATKSVTIHYSWQSAETIVFSVYDAAGHMVHSEEWEHTGKMASWETDISSVAPGMYFCTLRGSRQKISMPFVIVR